MSKYNPGDNVLVKGKVLGIVENGIKVCIIDDENNSNALWFKEEQLALDMTNVETIPQEEVMKRAYNQGLNDSSDAVIDLINLSSDEREEIFAYSSSEYVIENFTMKDIIAKLKAYEEAQNKVVVGDVVKCKGYSHEYVVMATSEETFSKQPFLRCTEPPYQVSYGSDEDLIKTGKHINILSQIGGE